MVFLFRADQRHEHWNGGWISPINFFNSLKKRKIQICIFSYFLLENKSKTITKSISLYNVAASFQKILEFYDECAIHSQSIPKFTYHSIFCSLLQTTRERSIKYMCFWKQCEEIVNYLCSTYLFFSDGFFPFWHLVVLPT